MSNIAELYPGRRLATSGEPPYDAGMEARVARLEASIEHIQSDVKDIKSDVRELRANGRADFFVTWGALIVGFLGIAGLMAHGFHWL
jgi:hypothetical protein